MTDANIVDPGMYKTPPEVAAQEAAILRLTQEVDGKPITPPPTHPAPFTPPNTPSITSPTPAPPQIPAASSGRAKMPLKVKAGLVAMTVYVFGDCLTETSIAFLVDQDFNMELPFGGEVYLEYAGTTYPAIYVGGFFSFTESPYAVLSFVIGTLPES
jgi:hypothetical protein